MVIGNIQKPPLGEDDTSAWVWKKFFQTIYTQSQAGILVPNGGNLTSAIYGTNKRNLIINGDMQVAQRGTSIVSTGAFPQWSVDRWAIFSPAGQHTVQQIVGGTLPVGLPTSVKLFKTVGNVGTSTQFFATAIESAIIKQLAGLPIVFSFWANFGSTFVSQTNVHTFSPTAIGNLIVQVYTGTGIDEGTLSGITGLVYVGALGITPINSGVWNYYTIAGKIPSTAKELQVVFEVFPTAVAGLATSYVQLSGLQLEIGTSPTAFDYRTFGDSLEDCQRFYQKSFPYGTVAAQNAGTTGCLIYPCTKGGAATLDISQTVGLSPNMYKTPTITLYNPAALNAQIRNLTIPADCTVSAVDTERSPKGFSLTCTTAGGSVSGNKFGVHWDATADI